MAIPRGELLTRSAVFGRSRRRQTTTRTTPREAAVGVCVAWRWWGRWRVAVPPASLFAEAKNEPAREQNELTD